MCGIRLRRFLCGFLLLSLLCSSSLYADVTLKEEQYQELLSLLDSSEEELNKLEKDLKTAQNSISKQMSLLDKQAEQLTQLQDTVSQQDKLLDELKTSYYEQRMGSLKTTMKTGVIAFAVGVVAGIVIVAYKK